MLILIVSSARHGFAKTLQCCLQMSCPFRGLMLRSLPAAGMQTSSSCCSCCQKHCQFIVLMQQQNNRTDSMIIGIGAVHAGAPAVSYMGAM